MTKTKDAAADFLSCRRIAVAGVARQPDGEAGNRIYARLRERGFQVFAVNPHATTVEGDPAYPDLAAIPGGVEALVIATRPQAAESLMRQAVDLGITRVWMHAGPAATSVSESATAYGREHGVTVIDGGCPLMFGPASDGVHKAMCWLLRLKGTVPSEV